MSSSPIPATRTHKLHSMATCWNGYASGTRCTVCCEHRPALAPVEGLLEPGDVELDLLLHLRGDAGSFFPVAVGHHLHERGGHDLPSHAELVVHPAADHFLAAILQNRFPVAIHFRLRAAVHA